MICANCDNKGVFTTMTAIGEKAFCCEKCYAEYVGLPIEKEGYYGFMAETFEAKGKGKSILEVFSNNNAVLEGIWGGKDEWESTYGHREVESFLIVFSSNMKTCELVFLHNLENLRLMQGFFLCGLVDFKDKNIWSWVQKGLYENPMWKEMQKLKDEEDSPLFKTMLKTYEKKLEEIGFENPRMDYYQEEGAFEMKFDSYTPVYCISHDWGEAYVKDLSKDGVTFQQECSFCGITRRGYSDVKLDWDMEAESFEASVVHRGKKPKGAIGKAMMNRAMIERAEIESVIQELENKVQLGIISEDDLMKSLTQRFGAEFEVIDWNNLHDTNRELFVQKLQEYYDDFKENNPELHKEFEERIMNEESWYGYERGKSYAETKEKWTKKLSDLGYEYERIDDYWEYIGYDNTPVYEHCNYCDGEGIIITKYYPATREDPADADYVDCEMCEGKGKVLGELNAETFEAPRKKTDFSDLPIQYKTNRMNSAICISKPDNSGDSLCGKAQFGMYCGTSVGNEISCAKCKSLFTKMNDEEKEKVRAYGDSPQHYNGAETFDAENEDSCFRCGCKGDYDDGDEINLVYCELCDDYWCNDACREPSCWDRHYNYTCTRNAAETFGAEAENENLLGPYEWEKGIETNVAPTELIKKRLKEAGFKESDKKHIYEDIVVQYYEPFILQNGTKWLVVLNMNEEYDGYSRLVIYENENSGMLFDDAILYEKELLKGKDELDWEEDPHRYYEVWWDGLHEEWKKSQKESHNCSDNADLEIYEDDFIVMECKICGKTATYRQETSFYGPRNPETFGAEAETKKRKTGFRKCSKCGYSDHNSSNCNRLDEYEAYRKHKDEMLKECDDAIQSFTKKAKRYSEDGEYGLAKMLRSDATDMKKLKRMIENNHFGKAVHFAMTMDSDPRELAPSALWMFDAEEVKLSKTSCCCGATESNPCACMKAPEPMNCSATEPKCPCYKDLEKNAETFENLNPKCIYMTNPKEASWVGFPLIEGKGQTDCYDLGYDMCESCGDFYGYDAETFEEFVSGFPQYNEGNLICQFCNADIETETAEIKCNSCGNTILEVDIDVRNYEAENYVLDVE